MNTLKLTAIFDRRPGFCHIKATGAGAQFSIYPNGSVWCPTSANVPKSVLDQVSAVAGNFYLFFDNLLPEQYRA